MRPALIRMAFILVATLTMTLPAYADFFEDAESAFDHVLADDYDKAKAALDALHTSVSADQAYVIAHYFRNGERVQNLDDEEFSAESMTAMIRTYQRHLDNVTHPRERTEFVASTVTRFYEKAADGGSVDAMVGLADYYKGKSPLQVQDNEKRRHWLKTAADAGSQVSGYELKELEEYLAKIASGDSDALFEDARELLYSKDSDVVKQGIQRIDDLAYNGYIPAMVFLGEQYSKARRGNTAGDFAVALGYFKQCAEMGDEECEFWVEDIQMCVDTGERCDSL